ncbi:MULTISPECIES: ATP-binding cassette domain-containing protein [unclassified Sphingomonas]|uniref:ATP-binding cassette domain-containing protein n=1 Tax=unclassified Sphingomonas TaxID=196159 RepID=UPI000AE04E6E|nr:MULTISPECIES: ATP-binding cassette domain-containing protein [unclassified Sphingomonas]
MKAIDFAIGPAVRRRLRATLAFAACAGVAAVLLLALSGWFLTGAAIAGAAGAASVAVFNYLLPSAAIRGLAIVRTAGRYGERLLGHQAALDAIADWRGMLFGTLAAQDPRTAPALSSGDASARLIGDIAALEDLIVRRPTRPASLIAALAAVVLAALAGWAAAIVLALLLAALPIVLRAAATRWTRAPAEAAADALGQLRTRFVDYAAARPEIIAYGLAARTTEVIEAIAAEADRARAALFLGEAKVAALFAVYGAVAAAAMLAVSRGPAPITALALLAAVAAIEAMAAFARTAVAQASVEQALSRLGQLATLEGMPFHARRERVEALPLQIGDHPLAPGDRIAITGPSGAGKTRLIEALAGLRRPVHALQVGGVAVGDCPFDDLAAQFALAPQAPMLVAGSIADNLRLARPGVDEPAMWAALEAACLADRVRAFPAGLETSLAEAGGLLSGGERKRLSIARAILAERPWMLLDEPSEGLDRATEQVLVARLAAWLDATRTGLILVSHRRAPLALATMTFDIQVMPSIDPSKVLAKPYAM